MGMWLCREITSNLIRIIIYKYGKHLDLMILHNNFVIFHAMDDGIQLIILWRQRTLSLSLPASNQLYQVAHDLAKNKK